MHELSKKRGRIESQLRIDIDNLEVTATVSNREAWKEEVGKIIQRIQQYREACYEEVMNGCTGYINDQGNLVHDGDTCPWHENEVTVIKDTNE